MTDEKYSFLTPQASRVTLFFRSSVARLTKTLTKAFDHLEEYTANAERLAKKIYQEDGAKDAALILEREAELTRH